MSYFFPALGAAVAIAGSDKLAGNRSYRTMFRDLGWSRDDMRAAALAEIAGGLLMAPRATRRLGGAILSVASASVMLSELRHGDEKLATARGLVLLAGLAALFAPGR